MRHANASSEPAVKLVIRLPASMRERLAEVAQANHRSMNSQIISVLEHALAEPSEDTQEDSQ
ncbi:Arc family DNA-binding protein [Pseudomonas sp. Choline-3u-10]|jgi:predicted HicB family RNase H-like nuclease|uniref:Arc family DNA-binding protein n=1 Tax=Pseudomonadaceae TaxID=135621 RepID=UPI0006979AE2|nr:MULTISPECIES: Arc family DNA-binding protein [Pseudomonadaceae]MBU0948991.1 Arc family DNA-binding protein [Gammaproteobacteria bacterium]HBM08393.1 Arc family DNA-binding protein [Pseudomonas sp.]MBK3796782.1 Arc family DNA-binding protein [Stutzerimonas stutzeri]MBK3877285.1 Arc family DNA-binding protein [Stutzerimonas stutzeri]PKG95264.1 Arc family DNA-binding protein [Pseudomonas sp. Choline-3u-10]|tara:strand:+ start:5866 stop:6051 length:186 start_codon:yes stop_codon:yes gene_type:complete